MRNDFAQHPFGKLTVQASYNQIYIKPFCLELLHKGYNLKQCVGVV